MFTKVFLILLTLFSFKNLAFSSQGSSNRNFDGELEALGSLNFYLQEWKYHLNDPAFIEEISFTDEEVDGLWSKASPLIQFIAGENTLYFVYREAKHAVAFGDGEAARKKAVAIAKGIHTVWEKAIDSFILLEDPIIPKDLASVSARKKSSEAPNFKNNPYVSSSIKKKMKPYLLSSSHRVHQVLDSYCLKTRITTNEETLAQAGFSILKRGSRSYIRVARHPQMPGYLVKVYLDNIIEEKQHKESWKWLVQRCQGAKKIAAVIKQKNIQEFTVASKRIYCLPPKPSPPKDEQHTRHLALLVVTDMQLVSTKENLHAWKTVITPKHLDELYAIISRAKGSSYRPDNIAYTKSGKFAFIDTEYPSQGPDYKRIRKYLSKEMCSYWDKLVKNGGH